MGDLSTLLDLGLSLDERQARRAAERQLDQLWQESPEDLLAGADGSESWVVQELAYLIDRQRSLLDEFGGSPPLWLMDRSSGRSLRDLAPDLFHHLAWRDSVARLPAPPRVRFVRYENPLEVVLAGVLGVLGVGLKHGSFIELAKLLRDWNIDQEQGRANVAKTRAEAAKTRAEAREANARASRIEFDTQLRRRIATADQDALFGIADELTDHRFEGLRRLATVPLDLEVEDDAD